MNAKVTTPFRQRRASVYHDIAQRYLELMEVEGAQSSAVVKTIATEMGEGLSTCYKALRLYHIRRKNIDKEKLIDYYTAQLKAGVKPSKAKVAAAERFLCSVSYLYKLGL